MAVLKFCSRCGALVDRGHKHRVKDSRPSAHRRGYNAQHKQDREDFFRMFPLCQHEDGCLERATDLDHIDGDPFNRDWGNYRSLCGRHHKQRTAQDQPGGWNAR